MPYPLNNHTTTDNYDDRYEVILSPPRADFTMIVTNAAVYYKVAPAIDAHPAAATYLAEVFAPPGRYFFNSGDFLPSGKGAKLHIRSAVVGVPAQVTVS